MQVKQLMSRPVVTCPMDATADQAARLMWEFDCGVIPVVGDDGRLAGVVTDRDICMAAYTQGRHLAAIPVASAMAKQVVAVHVDDAVEQVEALLADNQVHRVPVIDGTGRPVGVVSTNDLVRLAARARQAAVHRELVKTLAAICEPRTQTADRPDGRLPARRGRPAGAARA